MRTLTTVNLVADLTLGVIDQNLALTALDKDHKGSNQNNQQHRSTIAVSGCIAPVRTSSSRPPIALGKPAAIPAKMMIEIPLPRPRSVICSPSHIRNIVPVTKRRHRRQAEHEARIIHQARLRLKRDSNAQALKQRQHDVP
jgi:hypothetical protein